MKTLLLKSLLHDFGIPWLPGERAPVKNKL